MRHLRNFFLVILLITGWYSLQAQSPKVPLSRVINVPSTIQIAPSLSGDGKHMIFTTTANLKSELLLHYSYQSSPGQWTQPKPVVVINRSQQINHLGGYSLSYDGRYIFFTSRKTYGIGKYDIWYCERQGENEWSAPVNLGKPVNSTSNDGCPSLSPDGRTLYFVRCRSMDLKDGEGCVLMMSERKSADRWNEPKALPPSINSGNILSPRILADNQTLIFAKGSGDALDLFQTKKIGDQWTKPVALDYLNTDRDERFASVPGQGDVIYYSAKFQGTYDIIKARIPEAYQPEKVVLLTGEVRNKARGNAIEAFIQLYDLDTRELVQFVRTTDKDGSFEFFITGGRRYDFSVIPLDQSHTFYSDILDLTNLQRSTRQQLQVDLEPLTSQVSFMLNAVRFENDSTLSDFSSFEMSRLFKLIKNNPGRPIEIAVHRDSWQEDTTSLEPLLVLEMPDSLETMDSLMISDSLLLVEQEPPPDPTEIRAQAIARYLQDKGVPQSLLVAKGYADSQPVVPNDSNENRMLNRRVEIRIL